MATADQAVSRQVIVDWLVASRVGVAAALANLMTGDATFLQGLCASAPHRPR